MKFHALDSFVPKAIDEDGAARPIARAAFVALSDLFGSLDNHISDFMERPFPPGLAADSSPVAAFAVGASLAITVAWEAVRPSHIQCLLAGVARLVDLDAKGPLQSCVIDATCGLTFWTHGESQRATVISDLWRTIISIGEIDSFTTQTTPRLYGNKLRLTGLVAPIVTTHLASGAPVLDLMSGTGVVSRALSRFHPVSNNDANAYAALLTRNQSNCGEDIDAPEIISNIQDIYIRNQERLSGLIRAFVEREDEFLHGEITAEAVSRYAEFTSDGPLTPSDGTGYGPARLVTERYANIYFGIAQSIEIDSLRAAIDACYPGPGSARDLCLSALLLACTACSSGPHFAQPPRLKPARDNSIEWMRTLIERRALSISWEFDLALGRLAARAPLGHPFGRSSQSDWREAISQFALMLNGHEGGVYVDPPYSKLQYSRYYHVLNVILAYNYPPVSGVGRYPPREQRFSSRFEYQPGGARRELGALLRSCAERGLTTFLSYSDGGFVPVEELAGEMRRLFHQVEIFTEEIRHHPQGRPLRSERAKVIEHVIVGSA